MVSTQLRDEKAYSRAVFRSHSKYKEKCEKLWDQLYNSENQKAELLVSLKDPTKQIEAVAEADLKDDVEARTNCRSSALHISQKTISGVLFVPTTVSSIAISQK